MECRRGLAMRILSVCLSNACIVTKRKKDLSRFLYHTKDHLASVTVVEDRPIMSVKYSPSSNLPLLAKTNAPCSAVSLR